MLLKRQIQNLLKQSFGFLPKTRPFYAFNLRSFLVTAHKQQNGKAYPFEAIDNAKISFKSLMEKQLLNDEEMNKLLDSCIFLKQMNLNPEISYHQHQKIILTFNQLMENNHFSFSLMRKFIKYAQKFNISSRINSSNLLTNLLKTKVIALEDQRNLPEILNFFSQSNAPKKDLLRLLDKIVPVYDGNLVEIEDSTIISLFYHIVFFDWKYDKKPELPKPKDHKNQVFQMQQKEKGELKSDSESSDINEIANNITAPMEIEVI